METSKKLFSQKSISIATYLGGPIAAGYLIKKNYEAFDLEDAGKKAFILGIISTFALFGGIFAIPEHIIDKIPNAVIPAIYTGIIYLIVDKIQGSLIAKHTELGAEFHSGWKSAGIGAIFMVILMVLLGGTAFITGDLSTQDFDNKTYKSGIDRFVKNESQSLTAFNLLNTEETNALIREFNKGIVLWEENKEIITNLNTIENLPSDFVKQNVRLLEYSNLRIQHHSLIVKALTEETDKYALEIEKLGEEIESIIEKIN